MTRQQRLWDHCGPLRNPIHINNLLEQNPADGTTPR